VESSKRFAAHTTSQNFEGYYKSLVNPFSHVNDEQVGMIQGGGGERGGGRGLMPAAFYFHYSGHVCVFFNRFVFWMDCFFQISLNTNSLQNMWMMLESRAIAVSQSGCYLS